VKVVITQETKKIGDKACPFNSLYWNFFVVNNKQLNKNPRLAIVNKQIQSMDRSTIKSIQMQAKKHILNIENL